MEYRRPNSVCVRKLHPPYSPDLALSVLFPKLKEILRGRYFLTDNEVWATVRNWINTKHVRFLMDIIQKWIHRLEECTPLNDDYM